MNTHKWLRGVVAILSFLAATGSALRTMADVLVPYVYAYDNTSAKPENYGTQGETQTNTHVLNDDVTAVGVWAPWETNKGLQLYTGNNYLGAAAAGNCRPAIVLTLTEAPATLGRITIWYFGGGLAGVNAPARVTIADGAGHSATATNFTNSGNDILSLDVPVPGLTGQTLYLNFSNIGEYVGLSELQVFASGDASTWSKDADGNWSDIANWTPAAVPNEIDREVVFGGSITQPRVVAVDGKFAVGKITLNSPNQYTVTGEAAGAIALKTSAGGGAVNVINGSHEIAAALDLAANADVSVGNSADTLTLSGAVRGAGMSIRKYGAGTLVLGGAGSTYSGATSINAGLLKLASSDALGHTSGVTISYGTRLDLAGQTTAAPITLIGFGNSPDLHAGTGGLFNSDVANAAVLNGSLTLSTDPYIGGPGDITITGPISGVPGAPYLAKVNSGTLTIQSNNASSVNWPRLAAWGGTILLDGGENTLPIGINVDLHGGGPSPTLDLNGNNQVLGTLSDYVTGTVKLGGATLTFGGSGDGAIHGVIEGEGNLIKRGSGAETLSGLNTFTGNVTVDAGRLVLDNTVDNSDKVPGVAAWFLGGGTLALLGNASAETTQNVPGATLHPGSSGLAVTSAAGQTTTLDLTYNGGAVVRQPGATLNCMLNANGGTAQIKLPGAPESPVGPWATISGRDWAYRNGDNFVQAYNHFVDKNDQATWAAGDLVRNTGPFTNSVGNLAIDSLEFNAPGMATANLAGTLTIARGIIVTSNVGAGASRISGGKMQGPSGGELVIHQFNTVNTLQIDSLIGDNNGSGLIKGGPGALILTADNTYTGDTVVGTGDLHLGFSTASGAVGGKIVLAAGSRMFLNRSDNYELLNSISGAGELRKLQSGSVLLSGKSSYSGGTRIVNGTIQLGSGTALGTGPVTISRDSGIYATQLDLNGQTIANKVIFDFEAVGPAAAGSLVNSNTTAVAVVNGDVQIGGNQYTGGGGSIVFNGRISGGFAGGNDYAFYQQTSGTWTYNHPASTFDGYYYIVGGGITEVTRLANKNEPSSLGRPTADSTNQVKFVGPGGTLRYIGSAASTSNRQFVVAGSANIIDASGTAPGATLTLTGPAKPDILRTFTLTGGNTGDNTYQGVIGGTVSVVKDGAGKWVLAGANTYSGSTTVNAGTLVATRLASLGGLWAGVSVVDGAMLAVRANDTEGWTAPDIESLLSVTSFADGSTLGVEVSAPAFAYSGAIAGGERLMKLGEGALSLSGGNGYTGGTIVQAGRLEIGAVDALPAGGSLTIGAGGTVLLASGLSAVAGGIPESTAAPVPEPGALMLLVAGSIVTLALRLRSRMTMEA